MKSAGTVPRGAVDVSDLAHLTGDDGPYLTVYVPTESGIQKAADMAEAHWKSVRRDLAADGAPESALALVDPLVRDAHLEGDTLAVVANEEKLLLVEHLSEAIAQPRASWAPIADLVPIIESRQRSVPYVVVWADHNGADISGFTADGDEITETQADPEPALRKSAPGGWSQARYQRRAENDWADTANDVSQTVAEIAEKIDARVVVIGGDVRARHMVSDSMPKAWTDRAQLVEHEDDIARHVNTVTANDTVALLEKFKEELGQNDRAVEGIHWTGEALQRAAVDVLLVRDDRNERHNVPVEDAAAVDGLIRDAIATGASVRVIPASSPVKQGVGAILRWS
jgi:hypothetical protein